MTDKKDGRQIAKKNEHRCLRAIHRFGWLRTKDIAVLCWRKWPSSSQGLTSLGPVEPTASQLRMAQRTMRRLRTSKLVISNQGPDGSRLYALSEAGSRCLRSLGVVSAASGKDLVRGFSSAYYLHRKISNQIAIAGILQGLKVANEREIAQGKWIGGEDGIAGKRPDVLLYDEQKIWWIEVERSRKNFKDYQALLRWIGIVLRDCINPANSHLLGAKRAWGSVIFICTPVFADKLKKDLIAAGWKKNHIDASLCFHSELYQLGHTLFG